MTNNAVTGRLGPAPDDIMLTRLVAGGAWTGAVGGGLRILAGFIPHVPDQPWLELLYGVIDIGMLFGLFAAWLFTAELVGAIGLGGFVVALTGLASIVGPDSEAFGIDFYLLGAAVFMLGLMVFAIQLVRHRVLAWAGRLWLVAASSAIIFALTASTPALIVSGVSLGLGYIAAARAMVR